MHPTITLPFHLPFDISNSSPPTMPLLSIPLIFLLPSTTSCFLPPTFLYHVCLILNPSDFLVFLLFPFIVLLIIFYSLPIFPSIFYFKPFIIEFALLFIYCLIAIHLIHFNVFIHVFNLSFFLFHFISIN